MFTRDDNQKLTSTDRGNLIGDVMRRYWLPALLSSELPELGCSPVRVRLLREQLMASRNTEA